MFSLREKSRNDLQSQHDSTDYALRHRIYETQREKNELQWQHQKVRAWIRGWYDDREGLKLVDGDRHGYNC